MPCAMCAEHLDVHHHEEVLGLYTCVLEGVDTMGEPVDLCAHVAGQTVARRPVRAVWKPDDRFT